MRFPRSSDFELPEVIDRFGPAMEPSLREDQVLLVAAY